MKKFLLILALAAPLSLSAQQAPHGGIPDDVYYLLPAFADGYVYFYGQPPAQGKLNICALDQSLRFMDKDGNELEASNPQNVTKVLIDTVTFIRYDETFFRTYPVTADMGVALERKVRIQRGVTEAAYGGTSQTSSVRKYSSIRADGYTYELGSEDVPYEVSEAVCLYKGSTVVPFTKQNLRKLFPARKAEIDAWFKAGHALPGTVADARALLAQWAAQD